MGSNPTLSAYVPQPRDYGGQVRLTLQKGVCSHSSMDRVPVSETVDAGSIPAESTQHKFIIFNLPFLMAGVYISRAGGKLEKALEYFGVDVKNKVCMDVGAATGGFTDCLLQHGATQVYTVETGYGVLDWKLRNDPRVVVKERSNILYSLDIPRDIDIAVVDTSWTKLKLSVPATSRFVKPNGIILALIKPQYEIDKKLLRGGIVPEEELPKLLENIKTQMQNLGFETSEIIDSPITGEAGNREYWIKLMVK